MHELTFIKGIIGRQIDSENSNPFYFRLLFKDSNDYQITVIGKNFKSREAAEKAAQERLKTPVLG